MRISQAFCHVAALAVAIVVAGVTLAADGPVKGTIKGTVTYGEPIAKITVTIDGAVTMTTKTDANGQFVFKDLPAGEYKLEAKGVAKNNNRKSKPMTVTMPEPPKDLDPITVKLE